MQRGDNYQQRYFLLRQEAADQRMQFQMQVEQLENEKRYLREQNEIMTNKLRNAEYDLQQCRRMLREQAPPPYQGGGSRRRKARSGRRRKSRRAH